MRRRRLLLVGPGLLILGVVAFGPCAIESANQLHCRLMFRQVALGLQNYHDTFKHFPPAVVCSDDSKPMHSWRPRLLPFMVDFPEVYNWNEPWDSEDNLRLISGKHFHFNAPVERERSVGPYDGPLDFSEFFRCRSFRSKSRFATNVVAVRGKHTAWPGTRAASLRDFTDGPKNTILLVETLVPDIMWTEPRDLDWENMSFVINDKDRPCIGSNHPDGPCVAMADCMVYRLNPRTAPDIVRGLLTIDGGEPLKVETLEAAGWLRPGAGLIREQAN
jgi:hypothetical protein